MAEAQSTQKTGVMSREEAKRLGLALYMSGRPCRNGHDGERFVSNNKCLQCRRAALARDAERHPDRHKEWAARHKVAAETLPPDTILTCRKCGTDKPLADFRQHKDSGRFERSCRKCAATAQARYALADPERAKAISKRSYEANIEKHAARNAVWMSNNKEYRREYDRLRYEADPERARADAKASRARNPERYLQSARVWKRRNPERCISLNHRRRARLAGGTYTNADLERIYKMQRGRCACCGVRLKKFQRDHIIAVSKGGSNRARNIQLLCAPCNLSKGAKDPIDFMQSRGFLL